MSFTPTAEVESEIQGREKKKERKKSCIKYFLPIKMALNQKKKKKKKKDIQGRRGNSD